MGLTNIIDRRKSPYRFRTVNAIVEATWHDNSCEGADQIVLGEAYDGPSYEEREHISVNAAVTWANGFATDVTLYLYDWDAGIYVSDEDAALMPAYQRPTVHPEERAEMGEH